MHQDLPDGSAEQYRQAQPYVSDSRCISWTDGDAVAHEHQPGGNARPGRHGLGPGQAAVPGRWSGRTPGLPTA
jgi:hypothetical protein